MHYLAVDPDSHAALYCPGPWRKRQHIWAGSRLGNSSNFWSHCTLCHQERYDGFRQPYLYDDYDAPDGEIVTLMVFGPEPG